MRIIITFYYIYMFALICNVIPMASSTGHWGSEWSQEAGSLLHQYSVHVVQTCPSRLQCRTRSIYSKSLVISFLISQKLPWMCMLKSGIFFLTAAKDILQNMCSEVAKLENTDKESEAQKLICQAAFMAYEVHYKHKPIFWYILKLFCAEFRNLPDF